MHRDQQVAGNIGQKVRASVLRDAPEKSVVIFERRRASKLPEHSDNQQRQQNQTTMIRAQPLRPGTSQMPIEEPKCDEWVNIDNSQTEKLWRQPVNRA